MAIACTHPNSVRVLGTEIDYCEQCVQLGDDWGAPADVFGVRACGCCDSSKNKHARRHFRSSPEEKRPLEMI